MVVKVSKPELNLREKISELDKPSGVAGETMLRAETTQEQQALIGVGRRNLIINGDFQVMQRGTSFSSGFTADRWYTAAGTVTKDGLALKHIATNTDPYLLYKVEDIGNRFNGQDAIASFYLKTSSGINKLQYLTVCNVNYTHDKMYEIYSEIPGYKRWACPVKITNIHTDYIRIVVELEAVSGNISYLRQFQLELGKVATPFEHRSYGEELALCQRYYYQWTGSVYDFCTEVQKHGGSEYRAVIDVPVALRIRPTITFSGLGTWYAAGSLSAGFSAIGNGYQSATRTNITRVSLNLTPNSSVLAAYQVGMLSADGTANEQFIAFDSEV